MTARRRKTAKRSSKSTSQRVVPDKGTTAVAVAAPEPVGGARESEVAMEEYAGVSEERAGILAIVSGLEEQVDTAFELKEALEADLDAAQKKLSQESAVCVELEARVKLLESRATRETHVSLLNELVHEVKHRLDPRRKAADADARGKE